MMCVYQIPKLQLTCFRRVLRVKHSYSQALILVLVLTSHVAHFFAFLFVSLLICNVFVLLNSMALLSGLKTKSKSFFFVNPT